MPLPRRQFLGSSLVVLLAPSLPALAADASGVVRIPISLNQRRVLVQCRISGQGPFDFVFDTGGTLGLIDIALARRLHMADHGYANLSLSVGARRYPLYEAKDFVFGDEVRQPSALFAGVENFGFGEGAVGSLAAGVLSSVDGELDLAHGEWRIYRAGAPDRSGWTRYEVGIIHRGTLQGSAFLLADAQIGDRPLRFLLDTGMPTTLRLYRRTAEALGLWDAPRWAPAAPDGKARQVRVPAMTLAGKVLAGAVATVVDRTPWGKEEDAGIIGLPILRQFDLGTGAKEGATYLRPNGLSGAIGRYNMTGLWIDRDGDALSVGAVGPGSPAAAAGIKPGDRLPGADFATLLRQMNGPVGSQMTLAVESGGTARTVTLQLADYV